MGEPNERLQKQMAGDSNFLVNDPKAREVYLGPQFTM